MIYFKQVWIHPNQIIGITLAHSHFHEKLLQGANPNRLGQIKGRMHVG